MKRLLILLMSFVAINASAQIDLSCDASFAGVYPTVEVSYPIADKVVVGAGFGYDVLSPNLTERMDLLLGYKFDEWLQFEVDAGFLSGYDADSNVRKQYVPHIDFGMKAHMRFNTFFTLQVSFPGFVKLGFGFRLRPYKKLTVWDKQG